MQEALQSSLKVPELRRRLLYTAGFLALYRLGIFIPVPGISPTALADFWGRGAGGVFGIMNVLSGGAFERFSIFSLGIMPYINSSIILQLLATAFPDSSLGRARQEGEAGRQLITRWTRIGTVILGMIQGIGLTYYMTSVTASGGVPIVPHPGVRFWVVALVSLMAGTAFLMWIGERITEVGIGNGISLLIMAGIIAEIPGALNNTWQLWRQEEVTLFQLLAVGAVILGAVFATVIITLGVRKIPIQSARRILGRRVYGGVSQFLPLRVNAANVIPVIFAQALLSIPASLSGFLDMGSGNEWFAFLWSWTHPGRFSYNLIYAALIVGFTFFYTAIIINPEELADNLKRQGGSIPGIRPGRPTADFIERIVLRITLWGGLFLAAVCLLPYLLIEEFGIPFFFGGTALIIVVGVSLDTVAQLESFLLMRHYEGFLQRGVRGRRG